MSDNMTPEQQPVYDLIRKYAKGEIAIEQFVDGLREIPLDSTTAIERLFLVAEGGDELNEIREFMDSLSADERTAEEALIDEKLAQTDEEWADEIKMHLEGALIALSQQRFQVVIAAVNQVSSLLRIRRPLLIPALMEEQSPEEGIADNRSSFEPPEAADPPEKGSWFDKSRQGP